MSGKLDQSLDQIMQDSGSAGRRRAGRPKTNRRAAQKAKAAIAAPAGGVQKNTKAAATTGKGPVMAAPRKPANTGDCKVIITGLPTDVDEPQLKEYINKAIGVCKRAMITYGPEGRSRGIATVVFASTQLGKKCVDTLNGVAIDKRPLKVEFVVDASQGVAATLPKALADRLSKPKSAAKDTKAAPKGKAAAPATNGTGAAAKKGGKGKKAGNAGRPKKKTADELDAEMMDYFGNESAPTNGTAATNGAEPVDEVM